MLSGQDLVLVRSSRAAFLKKRLTKKLV